MIAQNIAEGLNAFPGVQCEVLVCRDRGGSTHENLNGIPVARVASLGTLMSMPISPSFPFRLKKVASQFDIVHVHTPFPLAYFCDWNEVKKNGARLVVHYHGHIWRRAQKVVMWGLANPDRRFMKTADRIIVTSERLLDDSQILAPFRDKCCVVPLSMDVGNVELLSDNEKCAARHRFGMTEDSRIVLFAGRLVYYKGVQYLIDAVRDLDVQVLIAGSGPLHQTLQKQIDSLGLEKRVRLLGRVSDADLSVLYSIADLFVLPSAEPAEAFGFVQLEAMARGLPVINTDLPTGVPSVSLHGETGLTVPPGDSAALKESISKIMSDNVLRSRFAANAKQRVQLFSHDAVMHQILSLYEELAPEAALRR